MRPTTTTVSLSALKRNLKLAGKFAPGSKNVAVIKANAYGHGAHVVAQALESEVDAFAVAFFDEAVQLRDKGIRVPILVLQGNTGLNDVKEAAARDFWLMLHDHQQLEWVLAAAVDQPVNAWLKVDTGMHRLGMDPGEAVTAIERLLGSTNVCQPPVLCTHLACANETDHAMTNTQVAELKALAAIYKLPMSIANSAGIMHWPESHAHWNRPGYMLYGNSPTGSFGRDETGLVPAMTVHSELIAVRQLSAGEGVGYGQRWTAEIPSTIGTIPIGYGDGYPRHAPDGTPVLVKGKRVPLAGTVSMDTITVDLTGLEDPKVGDPVELWGQSLSVNEIASIAGTIGYEILAGLSGRVPLVYTP